MYSHIHNIQSRAGYEKMTPLASKDRLKAAAWSVLQPKTPSYSMSQTFTKGKKNKITTPLGNKSCISKCIINYALFINN